jgi:hypothetical protein
MLSCFIIKNISHEHIVCFTQSIEVKNESTISDMMLHIT